MTLEERFAHKWTLKPTHELVRKMGGTNRWSSKPGMFDEFVDSHIEGTKLYAYIDMRFRQYNITIEQIGKNKLSAQCNCEFYTYDDNSWLCDHATIALRHLADNFDELTLDSYMRKERIAAILEKITHKQALDLLASIMEDDNDLYQEIAEKFGVNNKAKKDYELELDRQYYLAMDEDRKIQDNLDFKEYFDIAFNGSAVESANVCKAIAESIQRNIDMIDDSDGYYTDCFAESIESMIEAVLQMPNKKEYIKYITMSMIKSPKNLSRHYQRALETVCTTEEDVTYLDSVLQSVPKKDDDAKQTIDVTLAQIFVLEQKDKKTDDIIQILSDTYHLDTALRIKYIQYLHKKDKDTAAKTAIKLVNEFSNDQDTAKAAFDSCETIADSKYFKLGIKLFASTGDWKYYSKIKKSQYGDTPEIIYELIKMKEERKAIEVCIKEKMYTDAINILKSKKSLSMMSAFVDNLGKKDSEQYFVAYSQLIKNLITQNSNISKNKGIKSITRKMLKHLSTEYNTDEKYNARVRNHLLQIKRLGDKRYTELLKFVRSKNSKNKALLDVIHDL